MSIAITLDRSAELHIEARVKVVTVEPPPPAPTVTLSATLGGFTSTHFGGMNMYTLPADKQVRLQIGYTDANGNPATVDGAVSWESSDDEIAKCEPLEPTQQGVPEGGVIMLVPGSKIGNCQITAKADADLGEGTRELVTPFDVTVVAGEAVAGTITPAGEPTDRPT